MCGKPTINGTPGYSWNGEAKSVYPLNPPELKDGDELLYDEPGRCGGLDSHCHHVRLVKRHGRLLLLVRNGGGDHEIRLPYSFELSGVVDSLDSNSRYWLLLSIYNASQHAEEDAYAAAETKWRKAAAEKRIRTRKQRSRDYVRVWIDPA